MCDTSFVYGVHVAWAAGIDGCPGSSGPTGVNPQHLVGMLIAVPSILLTAGIAVSVAGSGIVAMSGGMVGAEGCVDGSLW